MYFGGGGGYHRTTSLLYYYYYYYTIWMFPVTGLFFLVLLLNQW
jgi:hypothetical protein